MMTGGLSITVNGTSVTDDRTGTVYSFWSRWRTVLHFAGTVAVTFA
jgi:hypothetical protein